tara:strand:- start:1155 stop:2018 length:864 start_codon:yes stop_codon:yes gene_type:complete
MGFLDRFASKEDQNTQSNQNKVIAFINQKGGVGKTTMAFNCAHALAKRGKRVLAIDLDPQANLSLLFGFETSDSHPYHIHHLMLNSVRELKALHVPAMVQDVMVKGTVDLLPAGQELSGFELTVAGVNFPRQLILKKFLEKNGLLERYDFIVIDCPPTLGLLVVNGLCASAGVIVPFRPDEFSRKGLSHLNEVLADIDDMGVVAAPKVLAHVPNLVDIRRKQEEQDLALIAEDVGAKNVMDPFFNRAQLVKSQAARKSVYDFQAKEFLGLQKQFNDMAELIDNWNVQ